MDNKTNIRWMHSHNFVSDNTHRQKKVTLVFWLTTLVMIIEIAAGLWSGSMALLADGWHMGTHSAAFAVTLFAYSYAEKHADNRDFSFGTGKVNYLGGFASAVALAIVALIMAIESVERLLTPQSIHFNEAIFVAFIGLTVNFASVFLLKDSHHEHDHQHHDQHHHDHNLKAAYFHVLADTLTSILAIIALFAGKYYGLVWMDSLMGIVGAIIILRWSYGLVKESSEVLLDKSTCSYEEIAQAFAKSNGSIINDIHIWKLSAGHKAAILSVSAEDPLTPEEYKQILTKCEPNLSHISIEINS